MSLHDKINKLPGFNKKLPSKMYGGYINLDKNKNTFYMFIEAEKKPHEAPIMFWTNGGPGCSGLMGLFEEIGPFRPNKHGKLDYNPLAWTKFANIVFVEQPIGVGFSWSKLKKDYKSNDDESSEDNLNFVLNFFKKYPEFKKNKLYLISESYGGHYVPQWANKIINYNKRNNNELNFNGFMVGNPYINYRAGTEAQIETYWGHQRISKEMWDRYNKMGCRKKNKTRKLKNKCNSLAYKISDSVGKHNPYALSYPLCVSHQQNNLVSLHKSKNKTVKSKYNPCLDNYTKEYLNRKDVQNAIHAKASSVKWKACSDIEKYRFKDAYNSQVPLINKMLNDPQVKDLNVFIMSGTNDSICGTVSTQEWIEELDIKPIKKWKQYFVDKEPAGYLNTYRANNKKRFLFATVNGAGHEIPMYKPEAGFYLMKKFINGDLLK